MCSQIYLMKLYYAIMCIISLKIQTFLKITNKLYNVDLYVIGYNKIWMKKQCWCRESVQWNMLGISLKIKYYINEYNMHSA